MTQGDNQVAEQDADNDEDQGQVMSDVHESVAVVRPRRNPLKPSWLTTDLIVGSINNGNTNTKIKMNSI